jgi:membrane fusion protein, multidrug efflux system
MDKPVSPLGQVPWKRVIPAIVVGVSVIFIWARTSGSANPKSAAALPSPTVTVATAQKGDLKITLDALGTVTPLKNVTITARVNGQITKVLYTEGQMVKVGDPLIEIDPRPYRAALLQAKGQLAKDEATLKEDQIDLTRYQQAYESQAISKQQVDDQVQVVKQFEGSVLADNGNIESAQANLDYCFIKSPISGRLGLRLVDPGNMIQSGSTTPLVVITQLQPISVVYTLAEDDIAKVQEQLQQKSKMVAEAYDRAQTKKLANGTFTSLDNQVDPTTGTVKARATYPNTDLALFPSEFVNVKMLVKTEHDLLRVPTVAIQRGAAGNFVYVVSHEDVIHVQNVEMGMNDSTYTSVTGVHEGDRVATSNFDKLQEGTHVKVKEEKEKELASDSSPTVKEKAE